MKKLMYAGIAVLVALSTSVPVAAGGGTEVRLRTALTGGRLNGRVPSGQADYRARTGRSSFTVEVEDVNVPGARLNVFVNSGAGEVLAGSLVVSGGLLSGVLDLDSQDGDTVPEAAKGTIVTVRTLAGQAVLSGVF